MAQGQLPGYERDINEIIDIFAQLANQEQVISFNSFKRIFKGRCCAYIHQAYWGCEHSPEYAQLLFAVALDRLIIPSPTAPKDSPLWQLHQLVPKSLGGPMGGGPTQLCSNQAGALQQQPTAAAAAGNGDNHAAGAAPMELELAAAGTVAYSPMPQTRQCSTPQPVVLPSFTAQPFAANVSSSDQVTHFMGQQQQQQPEAAAGAHCQLQPLTAGNGAGLQQPSKHHTVVQRCCHINPSLPHTSEQPQRHNEVPQHAVQLQQQVQHDMSLQGQQDQPQQEQPQQQEQAGSCLQPEQEDLVVADLSWLGSPLLSPQQQPQGPVEQPQSTLSPSDAVWQLMSPTMSPVQHQVADADDGADGAAFEGFMLPSPAVPAGQQQQQQDLLLLHAQESLQHTSQQQQQLGQQGVGEALPLQAEPAAAVQGQDVPAPPALQPGLASQDMPAAAVHQQQLHSEWAAAYQQLQSEQAALYDQEGDDSFLADLLSIFEELPESQQQQQWLAPAAEQPGSSLEQPLAGPPTLQPAAQQELVVQIPLEVKAAVVFTLLALHESQLNFPKVPIYVALPLLQQLSRAAADFAAAGAPAADALRALQVLTSQQRLLVGQFQRPNRWQPQLPRHLMPQGRLPGGLGLHTAVGAATQKAGRSAAQSAAVAAAARAVQGAAGLNSSEKREALFHIKSALRGLSNFRSLQALSQEYACARKAVFEPLLGGTTQHSEAAPGQQDGQQQQQQQQCAPAQASTSDPALATSGVGRDCPGAPAVQAALVVARGGSRRKRKAAIAASSHTASAAPAAAHEQPPADRPPHSTATDAALPQPAEGLELPGLFDPSFASALQGLANSEASRMLLLLDPYYNASKVRKRAVAERRAVSAAEAAAAAAAQDKLDRFKRLTLTRASTVGDDAAALGGPAGSLQQRQGRIAGAALSPRTRGLRQELLLAGILSEQELDDLQSNLGPGVRSAVTGGVQQVLRRAAQQRQATVQVAEEWLRAQEALQVVDDNDDDMP